MLWQRYVDASKTSLGSTRHSCFKVGIVQWFAFEIQEFLSNRLEIVKRWQEKENLSQSTIQYLTQSIRKLTLEELSRVVLIQKPEEASSPLRSTLSSGIPCVSKLTFLATPECRPLGYHFSVSSRAFPRA
ncbi:hypothetical protein RMATCC62417_16999 [Rhizopus microsporus]|nr:hypothetical protein RMATCC62417_16999 [Rhizopus microsporus]